MRVVAGRYKGIRLKAPTARKTRPILDRVKVSMFDWIGSRLAEPGRLPPIHVCDLFGGAGSQGIEALSRGARSCTFVESDGAALACLRENLKRIAADEEAVIVDRPVESVSLAPGGDSGFGLILVDPPYRLSEDLSSGSVMERVIGRLGTQIAAAPDALLLWRHSAACMLPERLPSGWDTTDRRVWGSMAVTMFVRSAQEPT